MTENRIEKLAQVLEDACERFSYDYDVLMLIAQKSVSLAMKQTEFTEEIINENKNAIIEFVSNNFHYKYLEAIGISLEFLSINKKEDKDALWTEYRDYMILRQTQ